MTNQENILERLELLFKDFAYDIRADYYYEGAPYISIEFWNDDIFVVRLSFWLLSESLEIGEFNDDISFMLSRKMINETFDIVSDLRVI